MFNLKILDTDLFLDMSISARLLYYDLSMRADDDGFVASPKKIQRMIGASDDDLKVLIGKQFIIPFEKGICVIKHWKIHNYIQKDRYTPTFYKTEMAQLIENDGSYEVMDTECVQNGRVLLPQVRLGKVRLEVEENIEPKEIINVSVKKIEYAERVHMLEDEYEKLINKYSQKVIDDKITDLDLWKGSTGKKNKSDYLTLLTWLRKDTKVVNKQQTQSSQVTPKCKGV